jgi:acyl carrier protein
MSSNFTSVLKILNIDQELLRSLESFSEVPGWDSIMQMQLIVTVEAQVGFELSVEDIQDLSPARLFEIYGV